MTIPMIRPASARALWNSFPARLPLQRTTRTVFASPTSHRESLLSVTQALLRATTEPGGLFYFDGQGYVRLRRFASESSQDTDEYGGSAHFFSELSAKDELKGSLTAQHRFEARTDIETPNIEAVSLYNQWLGELDYLHTL